MKKYIYLFLLIALFLFTNCYEIESVDQANSAEPNSTLDVPIIVSIWEETHDIKPNFGVRLPVGWFVQEPIQLEGAVEGTLHYSQRLSASMQKIDPAPPGYTWWIAEGEPVTAHEGRCSFVARLQTNDKTGVFFIDYVIGSNGSFDNDYTGDDARSNGHLLSVGITRTEADLYISPAGNDQNSGLSFADPLKTITMGLAKIVADSLHPLTLHLANGIYSPSNGEYLPIRVPNYVSIAGESKEGVVLDGEHQNGLFVFDQRRGCSLANMTIENVDSGRAVECKFSIVTMTNITIRNNKTGGIYCDNSEIALKNARITGNIAGNGAGIVCHNSAMTCENTLISNNIASHHGGGLSCEGTVRISADNLLLSENSAKKNGGSIYCSNSKASLKNVVVNNSTAEIGGGIYERASDLILQGARIENNTATLRGGGIYCAGPGALNLEKSTIRWNEAGKSGGGIYKAALPKVKYDSLARCHIYENRAGVKGLDLYNNGLCMNVVVDTFTTLSPMARHAYPLEKFTFDILHAKMTNVNDKIHAPTMFALRQNYPNPFNPSTTIAYDLPKPGHVHLVIYDLLGRHIKALVDEHKPAGRFRATWDGRDEHGLPVAGGLYFCRMQAGEYEKVVKMVLVR